MPGSRDALHRAHETLMAGCAFLLRTVDGRMGAAPISPTNVYARMQGNRLRELDRFLSILLDETAHAVRGADHDGPGFTRLRNTPNKLRLVETMKAARRCANATSGDDGRLRAIGRISACLNHCSGVVHAPDVHRDVLLAGGSVAETDAAFRPADRLRLSSETLDAIGAFYREIGDRLLLQAREASAQP
jgi:hypothetical protein